MADGGEDSDYIYIGTCANATWHQYHLNVQTTLNGMVKDGKLPADTDTKEMAAEIVRSVSALAPSTRRIPPAGIPSSSP